MGVVWFPEPPNEPEVDFSSSATGVVAPAGSSSDSDEDATDGLDLHYVLVPDGEESDDDVDDAQSQASSSGSPPPDESTQERCGVAETVSSLWSGPASDIALGEEKEAQVRAAMQGFTLPPSALPPWAAYVPEELWHSEIRRRLPTNQHLT